MNEERLCYCGDCKYCDAFLSSEYDYDNTCRFCNGGGCIRCEEG